MKSVASSWRPVYRWALDKTYLDTQFETLSEAVRIPFEEADDKVNIPGSAALLRELSSEQAGEPDARAQLEDPRAPAHPLARQAAGPAGGGQPEGTGRFNDEFAEMKHCHDGLFDGFF